MRDQRLDKLAQVLVNYSVAVQPGQVVRVRGDVIGSDLIEAIYEAVLAAGGHPVLRCGLSGCTDIFMQQASEEQLEFVDPLVMHEVETIDEFFNDNHVVESRVVRAGTADIQVGSAKSGVSHFIAQRVSAVALAVLIPIFTWSLAKHERSAWSLSNASANCGLRLTSRRNTSAGMLRMTHRSRVTTFSST